MVSAPAVSRSAAPIPRLHSELDYLDSAVRIRIRDNGPGSPPAPTAGHGLVGMRERAAMVGGELTTGPAPGNGFLVQAVLPTGTPAG